MILCILSSALMMFSRCYGRFRALENVRGCMVIQSWQACFKGTHRAGSSKTTRDTNFEHSEQRKSYSTLLNLSLCTLMYLHNDRFALASYLADRHENRFSLLTQLSAREQLSILSKMLKQSCRFDCPLLITS